MERRNDPSASRPSFGLVTFGGVDHTRGGRAFSGSVLQLVRSESEAAGRSAAWAGRTRMPVRIRPDLLSHLAS